ncbi:ASCH domain-containing protein [Candidatus Marsarchaeota archaeon]|jgi:ASC-1-like (ASCH) protein|nr:ASCH domain-containing protein [Candidatus Marsarchaeota archaeon]
MIHEMSLTSAPFDKIKNRKKTIEIRLYDEKRRGVKVGDIILFSKLPDKKEKIKVGVVGLSIFKSFHELFSNFDKSKFGHDQTLSIEDQINLQREHYTSEEEKQNGVVGIHIKLIE